MSVRGLLAAIDDLGAAKSLQSFEASMNIYRIGNPTIKPLLNNIKFVDNVASLNGIPIKSIKGALLAGKISVYGDTLFANGIKLYSGKGVNAVKSAIDMEMSLNATFRANKMKLGILTDKSRLANALSASATTPAQNKLMLNIFESTTDSAQSLRLLADELPQFRETLRKLVHKKPFYTRMGFLVPAFLGIGGTVALLTYIDKHRRAISGCFRVELIDNVPHYCKIPTASCENGRPAQISESSAIKACPSSYSIPSEMLDLNACAQTTGITCINCPPTVQHTAVTGNASDNTAPPPSVTYICNGQATIGATLVEMLGTEVDSVVTSAKEIGQNAFSLIDVIFSISRYVVVSIGISIAIAAASWIFIKLRSHWGRPPETVTAIDGSEYLEL